MRRIALIVLLFISATNLFSQSNSFIRGVDISFTPQIEDLGGKYKLNGVTKDVLDIFKESGVNYIRLRLWHTPSDGYCGLAKTLAYAKRIKAKGFKFLLDIHYSDWWADPGKQTKPAAWANLSFTVLKDSVYSYTKNVITLLKNQNTLPDMVQVGNEITNGMLWPDGRNNTSAGWAAFGELLKKGIAGVKDAAGVSSIKIMIHIDKGGNNSTSRWFFDNLIAQGVQFDVIGQSYYPWWHGTLTDLTNNINDLAVRYNKEIVVAETAYPWTTQYQNDGHGNIFGSSTALLPSYPATVKGQKDFLIYLSKVIRDAKNSKGIGFFYWEPSYISVPPIGSSWENLATFGFRNSNLEADGLESLKAFQNIDSVKTINVKIKTNTSTLNDTLKPTGFVQIRGEAQGFSSSLLPSGESITWDVNSQIVLKNVDGDNWEYQFKMYQGDQLNYKIWAGHTKTTATYLRLGWEGAITPYAGSKENMRILVAGTKDTTLQLQYFNSSNSESVLQYWTPIESKNDSVGILFRVNVAELTKKGLFDPSVNIVAVRGDQATSSGTLSWESNKLILKREEISVADGSFWSGVLYFPRSKIKAGTQIKYKFYVEKSKFGNWESGIADRIFSFPTKDSTLAWKFFNDKNVLTGIESERATLPSEYSLSQNYPNPFNPETTISYTIAPPNLPKGEAFVHVTLKVFDLLGREVATLVDEYKQPGTYHEKFNVKTRHGASLQSGVYFYRLQAGNYNETKKMTLLK